MAQASNSIGTYYTASVTREGNFFIAQCLEIDVASQGQTKREALKNLKKALKLHLERPIAKLKPSIYQIKIG